MLPNTLVIPCPPPPGTNRTTRRSPSVLLTTMILAALAWGICPARLRAQSMFVGTSNEVIINGNFALSNTPFAAQSQWMNVVDFSGTESFGVSVPTVLLSGIPYPISFGAFGGGSLTMNTPISYGIYPGSGLGIGPGVVNFTFLGGSLGDFSTTSFLQFQTPVASAFSFLTAGIASTPSSDLDSPMVLLEFLRTGTQVYQWAPQLCVQNTAVTPVHPCRIGGQNIAFMGIAGVPLFDEVRVFGRSGDGFYFDDVSVGSTSTVPEPATMVLLASGLLGMGAARRRRRTATRPSAN